MITLISPYNHQFQQINELPLFKNSEYAIAPFDERTMLFLDKFSKKILLNGSINKLPEIAALGFWLRKSNIENLKKQNEYLLQNNNFSLGPIGKVLHICPANVDTIFLYSMVVSLLMGNKNVLKVSSRVEAPSILEVFKILNEVLEQDEFKILSNYINIIKYNHDDELSNSLSRSVNARLIWGGDATIKLFKKFETAPRNKDIVFADRISMQVINCNYFLTCDDAALKIFTKNFYNDCYTFDQMGCSSPQTILLVGTDAEIELASKKIIAILEEHLIANYKNDISSLASLKFNKIVDDTLSNTIVKQSGSGYIKFVQTSNDADFTNLHSCGAGYFYTKNYAAINDIQYFNNPKIQTISYFGLNEGEINHLKKLSKGESIDRIVPLGKALDFNYIWDGYNLFDELSKKVQVI